MAESPVVRVDQDGRGSLLAYYLRHLSELFAVDYDSLDLLQLSAFVIKECNVDGLGSELLISILARGLSQDELGEVAIFLVELGLDLVSTLGLQPVATPGCQIKRLIWFAFIVALL